MECVGIGDCHLDKLSDVVPNANEKMVKSLETVFDWALDNGVYNIIQYGDVCERPRLSYEAQVLLYRLILNKKYKRLNLHFLLGNHDFAEDGTHSLEVLDVVGLFLDRNVHVYTTDKVVDIDGCNFKFLPYPSKATSAKYINVGHFESKGSLRDNGRKIDEGYETEHRVLMGHLHTKHRVRHTHHSGTLYQTNFGESMPKFFHHVTATGPKDMEVECVKFDPPWRLNNLTIESVDDLKALKKNDVDFYKLLIKDGVDFDINQVLVNHPNIVKHNSFKTKKELSTLIDKEFMDFDNDPVEDTPVNDEKVIREAMIGLGFTKEKVKRAVYIIRNLGKP